ncbi:hypothetical protein RCG24_05905 [Neobacillus sp. OS1-32]|jgi:hypothetical protein|uniref:Uncharacterized protein n=1 Tax=Neobacillus paridis TaxID=2803862 RepID=A0ABS1TPA8_9BACI|nr:MULTISPECIES: hypothetical protein [Neobacillus]MBL4953082.1 hypothetical protein [Neobacillus paridis]WML31403.1 hypothetical protein RCG24_05905 [Neobacillus sp. OS1-32]
MEREPNQQSGVNNEDIMNRVNQTFDKISQDVKEMIQQNDQQDDNQFS